MGEESRLNDYIGADIIGGAVGFAVGGPFGAQTGMAGPPPLGECVDPMQINGPTIDIRLNSGKRRPGGTAFSHLYGTARWQRTRARQLAAHPLCWRCEQRGLVVEATVCNHTHGHPAGETEAQFWAGPFDSQCATCHSGETAREERGRPIIGCDAAGWPTRYS